MSLRFIPWGGAERRQYERTKIAIPCRLSFDDDVLVGTTQDISLGGVAMGIEISPERAAGLQKRAARVALMLPRGELEVACRVVRAEATAVAVELKGFRGTEQENELKEFLRTQLSQLI